MFQLANTVWPRFGGDRANASLLSISGPHSSPVWQKVLLPTHDKTNDESKQTMSGVIIMPDMTLRVLDAGFLIAVTLEGTILWQVNLCSLISEDGYWISSLPTALQTGETLILLPNALFLIDKSRNICRRYDQTASETGKVSVYEGIYPDDSGYSPNLTYNEHLLLTNITGEAYKLINNVWWEIGRYGYDIITPAVYTDNSLAIAGFGRGFCRVDLNGEVRWMTHLTQADLLPTLNPEQTAAVGSLNDKCSAFFRSDGQQIGEYHHAARFAVYPDGGWIALSQQRLARLTLEGKEVWGREIDSESPISFMEQPLVDKDGFIFVRQREGYLCCDAYGRITFEIKVARPSHGLISIIAPGVLAYVMENELFVSYN